MIEKQNKLNINVFGYDEKNENYPLYITESKSGEVINMLLFSDGDINHYCWIKNLNKLLFSETQHTNKKYFCVRRLQHFGTQELLT